MNISVRKATSEDLLILYQFEEALIEANRPMDETMVSENFHYYDLAQMIADEDAEVFIAEMDGKPVGSGSIKIRKGLAHNRFDVYAHLGFMYTEPEYRRQGINQKIIEASIKWAHEKGLQEVRLQVYSENLPAIKAYEKLGFKSILTDMRLTK